MALLTLTGGVTYEAVLKRDLNLQTHDINVSSAKQISRGTNDPNSLRTSDINPAKPAFLNRTIHHNAEATGTGKEEVLNVSSLDVSDLRPAPRVPPHKPNYALDVSDIPGAVPPKRKVLKRITNPLQPEYKLPSYEAPPPAPIPFVHDGHTNNDIEGAQPRKLFPDQRTKKDAMNYSDVEGSAPKPRHHERRGHNVNPLDVKDITQDRFVTKRVTDPLSPRYVHGFTTSLISHDEGATAHVTEIGEVSGNKPRAARQERQPENQFALLSKDVAQVKSTDWWAANFPWQPRRKWNDTNKTNDIAGAQPSSKLPLRSRGTNPLDPAYQNPGHSEANPNVPFLEPEGVSAQLGRGARSAKPKAVEYLDTSEPFWFAHDSATLSASKAAKTSLPAAPVRPATTEGLTQGTASAPRVVFASTSSSAPSPVETAKVETATSLPSPPETQQPKANRRRHEKEEKRVPPSGKKPQVEKGVLQAAVLSKPRAPETPLTDTVPALSAGTQKIVSKMYKLPPSYQQRRRDSERAAEIAAIRALQ